MLNGTALGLLLKGLEGEEEDEFDLEEDGRGRCEDRDDVDELLAFPLAKAYAGTGRRDMAIVREYKPRLYVFRWLHKSSGRRLRETRGREEGRTGEAVGWLAADVLELKERERCEGNEEWLRGRGEGKGVSVRRSRVEWREGEEGNKSPQADRQGTVASPLPLMPDNSFGDLQIANIWNRKARISPFLSQAERTDREQRREDEPFASPSRFVCFPSDSCAVFALFKVHEHEPDRCMEIYYFSESSFFALNSRASTCLIWSSVMACI